ncbi:MAG: hypothetical protein GW893_20465 [Armatimonadetes bacterium]|nr:hypothetical protein [Armatimonadota bacterium]PIU63045.1 MAG: hypothetical protein COS85_16925 [Armatimonadetes bacterium CG07_land_8_20_14_0_80_59_28]PIY43262.1 MAG: hypothetical protein COZ05_11635 [Armatimonadetes bacterium CG_4_10_14_3_um_filter_59_10]
MQRMPETNVMMRMLRLLLSSTTFLCCAGSTIAAEEVPAERLLEPGNSLTPVGSVVVRAVTYQPAYQVSGRGVKFRLNRQWEWFECLIAVSDNAEDDYAEMRTYADDDGSERFSTRRFQDPTVVRVRVADVTQFRIHFFSGADEARVINPRFSRGQVPSVPPPGGGSSIPMPSGAGYSLSIDPQGISSLVEGLQEQVLVDPSLRHVAPVQLAVARFKLVSDPQKGSLSATVAENVLEDMSTALIKSRTFKLVERSQLDKLLAEMKIGESGLIDSATAQKLGRLSGAKAVLIGSISDRGKYSVINCRLINTETGEATIAEQAELRQ